MRLLRFLGQGLSALLGRVMLGILWFYRNAISPFTPPACRFQPTCSAFAEEAIRTHGPLRGGFLGFTRVMRCHPFSRGGFDPVPPSPAQNVLRDLDKIESLDEKAHPSHRPL